MATSYNEPGPMMLSIGDRIEQNRRTELMRRGQRNALHEMSENLSKGFARMGKAFRNLSDVIAQAAPSDRPIVVAQVRKGNV